MSTVGMPAPFRGLLDKVRPDVRKTGIGIAPLSRLRALRPNRSRNTPKLSTSTQISARPRPRWIESTVAKVPSVCAC